MGKSMLPLKALNSGRADYWNHFLSYHFYTSNKLSTQQENYRETL